MLQSFLRTLARRWTTLTRPAAPRSPRSSSSYRPQLEGLEDRMLLSTAALSSGVLTIVADPNAALSVIRDKTNLANVDVLQNGSLVNKSPIAADSVKSLKVELQGGDSLTFDSSKGALFLAGIATDITGSGSNSLVFQGGSATAASFTPALSGQPGSLLLGGVSYKFDQSVTRVLDTTSAPSLTITDSVQATVTVQNGTTLSNGTHLTDIQGLGTDLQVAGQAAVHLDLSHANDQVFLKSTIADPALKAFSVALSGQSASVEINSTPSGVTETITATGKGTNTQVGLGSSILGSVTVNGGNLNLTDEQGLAETITESSITGPGHAAIHYSDLTGLQLVSNFEGQAFTIAPSSSTASFHDLDISIQSGAVLLAPATQAQTGASTFDITVNKATELNLQINNTDFSTAIVNVHNPDGSGTASGSLNSKGSKFTVSFPKGANSVIENNGGNFSLTFDHKAG